MPNREQTMQAFKLQVIQAKMEVADKIAAKKRADDEYEAAQKMLALVEAQYAAVDSILPKEETAKEEATDAVNVGA